MTARSSVALAVTWGLSLLATGTWVSAQRQRWTPLVEPTVLAGDDLGFRVEWMNGSVPTGQIVIRMKGRWVEAKVGRPPNAAVLPPVQPPPAPIPPR